MEKKETKKFNNLLRTQIDKFFSQEKKDTHDLLNQISLLIFKFLVPDTDLYELYKNKKIDNSTLDTLVDFYDGAYVKFPSKQEWRDCLVATICFYMMYIKNKEWDEIKKELPIPTTELTRSYVISMGKKNKSFEKRIKDELQDVINSLDDKEVVKVFHSMWNNIADKK
jgi:hypothetical protein